MIAVPGTERKTTLELAACAPCELDRHENATMDSKPLSIDYLRETLGVFTPIRDRATPSRSPPTTCSARRRSIRSMRRHDPRLALGD